MTLSPSFSDIFGFNDASNALSVMKECFFLNPQGSLTVGKPPFRLLLNGLAALSVFLWLISRSHISWVETFTKLGTGFSRFFRLHLQMAAYCSSDLANQSIASLAGNRVLLNSNRERGLCRQAFLRHYSVSPGFNAATLPRNPTLSDNHSKLSRILRSCGGNFDVGLYSVTSAVKAAVSHHP